jgi:hypothetical protein
MLTLPDYLNLTIDEDVCVDHRELLATEHTTQYTKKHISHYCENHPINLQLVYFIKRETQYLLQDNPGVNEYPIYGIKFVPLEQQLTVAWWFRTEKERDQQFFKLSEKL